ncbi:hypothetical protein ACWELB_48865 [Streptomyces asiaticus]
MASSLVGRYRPMGVPRLGSREDRAEAYRRLLDASTRSFNYAYQFAHLKREAGRAAHKLLLGQTPRRGRSAASSSARCTGSGCAAASTSSPRRKPSSRPPATWN